MKKYFSIIQPPTTQKFTFLVDHISVNGKWGMTTDIDKINYNISLIKSQNIQSINSFLEDNNSSFTSVEQFGGFITVMMLRADKKEGRMTFVYYDVKKSRTEIRMMLLNDFSKKVADSWLKFYDIMIRQFTEKDDCVVLHKPDL